MADTARRNLAASKFWFKQQRVLVCYFAFKLLMLTLSSGLIIYKPQTGKTVDYLEFVLVHHQSTYDSSVKCNVGVPRRRKLALI
jgi:hypothetical protein